ncbi:MAG: conjugative transposon protein TraM [Sphingobacterium sp.]|uniref:conjugative transposon protein TraM n=1 Tax=Sphingobacterium sp. JB170 TaxID=1434842 RepID=UPI00097EBFEC|nr:conjugative transposon protein TraM [Sphingobacterium sp. JB170]SJN47960.1 Conjugative transposon protein TraM [Sphingobacterium sp. JB170]
MNTQAKKILYAIPLIALPFLLLIFYAISSGFKSSSETPTQSKIADSLQGSLADVSEKIKSQPLASKLAAYKQSYRSGDGYTAIGKLKDDKVETYHFDTPYSKSDQHKLDSIAQALKSGYQPAATTDEGDQLGPEQNGHEDLVMQQALAAIGSASPPARKDSSVQKRESVPDPMELFRQQMAYADSMAKANDPDYQAQLALQKKAQAEQEASESILVAKKYEPAAATFNTVTPEHKQLPIQAIIDENMTGVAGSRLRIRLLDDILIGVHHIKKGTYLYANISGFSGQRVLLSISSAMQKGTILPVHLELYDNDGARGLYVPASAFREFSRELGASGAQGITLQQQAENNSQLVMSLVQRMFQSTTSAVSKQIRKNKVKLKYNSLVYLIDPSELKEKASN